MAGNSQRGVAPSLGAQRSGDKAQGDRDRLMLYQWFNNYSCRVLGTWRSRVRRLSGPVARPGRVQARQPPANQGSKRCAAEWAGFYQLTGR